MSIDFFAVPTITMRVLFVFVVLEHRRQVLHFNEPQLSNATPAFGQGVSGTPDITAVRLEVE
jgi:hypothetical protein